MPLGGMLTMGLISAGTSIAGGLLGGNKKKDTPIYTKDQQAMQSTVGGDLTERLKTGGAGYFAPAKAAAIQQTIGDTNAGYAGLQESMQRGLTSRGFASSGKRGKNMEKLNIARTGQIGSGVAGINGQYDQMAGQYDQNTMNQALQYAFASPGNQQQQGTPLGNGLNSGMSTLSTLMALNGMLNGGNGFTGGASFGGGGGAGSEPIGTMAGI